MSTQAPVRDVLDPVNEPRHPFGLPMGSVRGFMSLLICGFFWLVLLWPGEQVVKPLLGHFFLLALVLMAFASSPSPRTEDDSSPFLPWLLRVLFVGGSVAVVLFCLFQYPDRLQSPADPGRGGVRALVGAVPGDHVGRVRGRAVHPVRAGPGAPAVPDVAGVAVGGRAGDAGGWRSACS